jgi:hypothetical protein
VFSCWRRGWCGEGGCGSSDQRGDQKGFQFGKGRSAFIDAAAWHPPACASLAAALGGRKRASAALAACSADREHGKGAMGSSVVHSPFSLTRGGAVLVCCSKTRVSAGYLHPRRRCRLVQRDAGVAAAAAAAARRPRITSDDAARAHRRARWAPDLPETTHPRRLTCRPQTLCNGAERRRKFYRSCLMRQIVELRCPRRPWNAPPT